MTITFVLCCPQNDVFVETHDDKLSPKITLPDGTTVFSKTKGTVVDRKTGSDNVYFSCTWVPTTSA
jgi:hypothetical protein